MINTLVTNIRTMDLEPVTIKMMDADEGPGWSRAYAEEVAEEYRRFLELTACYPAQTIVPAKSSIDEFWHMHILDTRKYAEDCQQAFGRFIHHFPYFGMRGDEDRAALHEAYDETLALYERHFGTPAPTLWQKNAGARCPVCGRRSGANASPAETRPHFDGGWR